MRKFLAFLRNKVDDSVGWPMMRARLRCEKRPGEVRELIENGWENDTSLAL